MSGPLIGLTSYTERATYWVVEDEETVLLPRGYVDMVSAAGGVPVLLPPTASAADAVQRCDGLLVTGGPDIGADRYGAAAGTHDDAPRVERDAADLAVLRRALERGIPVLGVCRGHQMLNVALGGTLHQHLPDTVGEQVAAEHSAGQGVYAPVTVSPEPGSLFARLLGDGPVAVRCHHHQAIDRLGEGLRATARAGDVIEAVEYAGPAWVLGVQSHPERSPDDLRIATALVDAARTYRDTGPAKVRRVG
ncbi:gamma-glutamyl-gamma-aminobutyrate hydrolase family protein [Pseudonocardia phyllosphaerae]|uniref:gamma-glutamyl-gamma-aminobutyrate hydrolase family protein n=1 Tax=Pseudonocardia phyllosphaerae TaxID=3390502 RepID=UPI003977EE2D